MQMPKWRWKSCPGQYGFLLYGEAYAGDFIRWSGAGISTQFGLGIDGYSSKDKKQNAFFLTLDYKALQVEQNNLLEGNEADYPFAVRIERKVSKMYAGITAVISGFKLNLGVNSVSKEYKTQTNQPHQYATLALGYVW